MKIIYTFFRIFNVIFPFIEVIISIKYLENCMST